MGFCIFFNKSLEQKTALIVHSFLDSGQQGIFVDWSVTVQVCSFTYQKKVYTLLMRGSYLCVSFMKICDGISF